MLSEIEGKYISVGEVFDKISSRQVTFDMVAKVFKDMTSEGGKFYKMQEVLAQTLQGKLSNLADAYQIMFAEIGQKTNGILVGSVDALRSLADNYEKIGKLLLELVAAYGVYKTAMIAVEVATKSFTLANHKLLLSFTSLAKKLYGVVFSNPYTALVAGATAAAFAIYKVATATSKADDMMESYNKTMDEGRIKATSEVAELERIKAKLDLAKEGTEEYANIRSSLYNKYGDYIQQLRVEGLEVNNLASIYDRLKQSVEQSALQRYRDKALTNAQVDFAAAEEEIMESFNARFQKKMVGGLKDLDKATQMQKEAIWQWIIGAKSKSEAKKYVSDAWFTYFAWMKQDYSDALWAYNKVVDEINSTSTKIKTPDDPVELEDWQKKIKEIISIAEKDSRVENGIKLNINVDQLSLESTIDTIKERIEDIQKQIDINEGIKPDAVERLKLTLYYYEMINREVLKGKASTTTSNGKGKSARQIELERERDTIKDIYEWYKKFTEGGLSEENTKRILTNIFPDKSELIAAGNYVEVLNNIATILERFDPNAAQSLRDYLGVSDAKSIYDAYQAYVKYNDEVNKLTDKFGFGGDKISRILVQLTTDDASSEVYFEKMRRSINEIEEYYKKTITGTEEEKNAAWEEWKRNGLITLEELYKAEKEYNRKVAQEKITDLAQGMVKDNYATLFGAGSKALSDWGDKTLAQIAEVISKLKIAQVSAGSLITPGLVQKAADLKINFTDLLAAINQIINADLNNAIDKYVNKAKEMAAATKTIITDLSSILGTIGDTLGDSGVKALSGTLSTISQVADVVLNCDEAVDMIAKNFMKATDEVDKLEEGMLSGAEVAEAMADEGVNIAKSFSIATMVVKIMILLISKIVDLWSDNTKAEEEATKEAIEYKKALLDVNAAAQDGIFGEDLWYNILVRMREYKATFKSLIEDIQKMADYDKYYALFPSQSMWSLDENGNVSISDIMAKYEAGLLEGADAIIENAKQLESAIADIFSQISDDIVNNMVTAFEETGDAMSDFENAFADLGENIAKSLLKSYIIEKILNNYKSKVYDAIDAASNATNTERGMLDFVNTIKTLTEQMRGDFEKAAPFFNELLSIIQDAFGSFTSDEGDTLASGIKGITEDTANLLASYVNAIRADVAATRLSIEGMSVDVKAILGLLPSTPTLAEYLTKIEANTFNTSLTTADILSEMRSMMTNDMGETALRVYM